MMKYILVLYILGWAVFSYAQTPDKMFPANIVAESTDTESLIKEAIGHYDGGRYEKAAKLIQEAMNVNQEGRLSDILFYYRALCHIQLEEHNAALADLDTAILFNNTKPHYYYHRANVLLQQEAVEKAFKDYEKTIELEPRYEAAWMKKGIILQQRNQIREALIAYNKTISLNDTNAKAYYLRGLIMLQVGMPDKGCADLEKSADLGHRPAQKAQNQYCSQ